MRIDVVLEPTQILAPVNIRIQKMIGTAPRATDSDIEKRHRMREDGKTFGD